MRYLLLLILFSSCNFKPSKYYQQKCEMKVVNGRVKFTPIEKPVPLKDTTATIILIIKQKK